MTKSYRQSQAVLRAILESPKNIVIFALDREYRYLAFNENHKRTMKAIWGVDIQVGDNMPSFISRDDDRERALENFDRALAGEDFVVIEEYGDEQKERRFFEDVYSPIVDRDGEVIGLTLYLTDITAQRRTELELEKHRHHLEELVEDRTRQLEVMHMQLLHAQKLESLGVLAGGVAHDFNNLLAVILGRTELAIRAGMEKRKAGKHLEMIRNAVIEARALTRQLLGYCGKGHPVLEVVDLNRLLDTSKQLLRATVNRSVTLSYEQEVNLPVIEGDGTQVNQVIMNLVTNAAESIDAETGSIKIRTRAVAVDDHFLSMSDLPIAVSPGSYVCLEVQDNGCGMSEAVRSKIFDPFFTTKFSGRGLGLASVLGIVRSHNGGIVLYSEPDKGTRVGVLFPVSDQGATMPIPTKSPSTVPFYRGQGTVLVVDDEMPAREVISEMTALSGFNVISAESGEAAIRLYKEHRAEIDVVMLDMTMPEMSGLETMHRLREEDPNVRIIITSGYSEETVRLSFQEKKPFGTLAKPFSYQELVASIRRILEK